MVNSGHRVNLSHGDVNSVDTVWQIEGRREVGDREIWIFDTVWFA